MERKRIDEKKSNNLRTPAGAAVMQQSVTEAIQQAFFKEWARVGFSALSIESVAKQAGVGKAAIYRRWPSKLAMAKDLVTQIGLDLILVPDTGSLKGDIRKLLGQLRKILRHPLISRILPDLHAEMARSSELAQLIRTDLQIKRRASGEVILRRAIVRKELTDELDINIALDMLGSMIYWRMIITKLPADNTYLDKLTSLIANALMFSSGAKS